MAEKIYIRNASGDLEPLTEKRFETEELLQELIGQHPELLAGEQINPHDPLRWILIRREMPIEGWAVDHLLLDQHARPTLVEVKLASNPAAQHSIVGQMLDYAAGAADYWSAEELQQAFSGNTSNQGLNPDDELIELLDSNDETDAEDLAGDFWENVATNLKENRLRLLFVADEIPNELERVVKFLNKQMRGIEVLAVEIKQFPGKSDQVLVSRVIGQVDTLRKDDTNLLEMTSREFMDEFAVEHTDAIRAHINDLGDAGIAITGRSGASVDEMRDDVLTILDFLTAKRRWNRRDISNRLLQEGLQASHAAVDFWINRTRRPSNPESLLPVLRKMLWE